GALEYTFLADSDAHIVRGLIAILFAVYNGRTLDDVLDIDADPIFAEQGLTAHLTARGSNGLASMVALFFSVIRPAPGSALFPCTTLSDPIAMYMSDIFTVTAN